MRLLVTSHVLTIVVAASYVTLALAAHGAAEALALPYGIATLALGAVNLATERLRR